MIDTALDLEPSEKKEHLKNLDFRPWTKTKNQVVIWCQTFSGILQQFLPPSKSVFSYKNF